MNSQSPRGLHESAAALRDVASECVTEEARVALLETADSLDEEAAAKEEDIESRFRDDQA